MVVLHDCQKYHTSTDFQPKAAQLLEVQYIRNGHLANSYSKQVASSISLEERTNVGVYAVTTEGLDLDESGRTG